MNHAPDPGLTDMEAFLDAAAQGEFLRVHGDLISPWRFPLPTRVQMAMGRLVAGWRDCVEKAAQ